MYGKKKHEKEAERKKGPRETKTVKERKRDAIIFRPSPLRHEAHPKIYLRIQSIPQRKHNVST
jgi:hypothetical protein